jgi:hypothetical protein
MAQRRSIPSSHARSLATRSSLCHPRAGLEGGALAAALALALSACAGAASGTSERYPEERRPDAPRSAGTSDDEVLGAGRQDPADTLDASLTNEHLAPRSPTAEVPANEAAHERLDDEECYEASKATPPTPGAEAPRRKPVCPPPRESRE